MKIVRPLLAVGLAGTLLWAMPADAASTVKAKTLTLTDQAGDANALSGQGFVGGSQGPISLDGTSTPVGSQADKDFTSAVFASTLVKKGKTTTCTGLTVTVNLTAAPGPNSIYRITGVGTFNAGFFWISYNGTISKMQFLADPNGLSSTSVNLINPAVVKGNSLVFTLTEADIKAAGEQLKNFTWSGLGAEDRSVTPAATVPVWDMIPNDDAKTFKAC